VQLDTSSRFNVASYHAINHGLLRVDVTFDMRSNRMEVHHKRAEPWNVTVVDTGDEAMTGGRLRQVAEYVRNDESFCMTYGDGVSNVDITAAIEFHKSHGKAATLTATYPPGRFGALNIEGQQVKQFMEKPKGDGALINGGFFVLSPRVLDYLDSNATVWEQQPLQRLATDNQLMAFTHDGFWQPMDTLRDKTYLEELWATGNAPWKTWQ